MSHLSPSHEPLVILYLVAHFSEVWKCGIVRQSKDNLTTLCHSLLSSTLLRSRCGSVEKSNEVRRMSHFSPSHEPFVILYLVPHFSEVFYSTEVCNCLMMMSQRFRDQGKSVTVSLLCQTFPHFHTSKKCGTK